MTKRRSLKISRWSRREAIWCSGSWCGCTASWSPAQVIGVRQVVWVLRCLIQLLAHASADWGVKLDGIDLLITIQVKLHHLAQNIFFHRLCHRIYLCTCHCGYAPLDLVFEKLHNLICIQLIVAVDVEVSKSWQLDWLVLVLALRQLICVCIKH